MGDPELLTDQPFRFAVGGNTYVGTMIGRFYDAGGNQIPREVGAALYDAFLDEQDVAEQVRTPVTRRNTIPAERVFSISGTTATPAPPASMGGSDLLERHLQGWVKQYPSILGEDLLVVTEEFDRWTTATGESTAERLDILALDRDGRLVVAELKRHRAPDAVLVQALNYAAMASRFDLDLLAHAHYRFLGKEENGGEHMDPEKALQRLYDWAPDVSDATLAPCRVVLVAEDYSPVLTNTAIFLLETGLDLRLMRVGLHAMPGDTQAMTATQVLPVPQASEFMVGPGAHPNRTTGERRDLRIKRLVEIIDEGTVLTITVPNVGEDREAIDAWLREDSARRTVTWHNDTEKPVRWAFDGSQMSMRDLIRHMITEATAAEPWTRIWGPNWLVAPDGRTVARIDKDERGRFERAMP